MAEKQISGKFGCQIGLEYYPHLKLTDLNCPVYFGSRIYEL